LKKRKNIIASIASDIVINTAAHTIMPRSLNGKSFFDRELNISAGEVTYIIRSTIVVRLNFQSLPNT